jgi:hypothetical protein
MTNDAYKVGESNFTSPTSKSKNQKTEKASFSANGNGFGLFTGPNYTVKAGFQHVSNLNSFSFSISSTTINYGDLTAGEPVTRTNTLTIRAGAAPGYQILALEDHEPRIPNGASIPDTTCDNGSCSETTPALWSSLLTYGFGYRCDNLTGSACNSGFSIDDNFKQFANSSKNETGKAVMTGKNPGEEHASQITYKINVSKTQSAGIYQNNIFYIAIPNL